MLLGSKPIGTVAYLGGLPSVLEEFSWSWSQMVQYNCEQLCGPLQYVHYDRSKISYHSTARNSLVERMQGDWLVQLDTDHSFDPDLIVRMVTTANKYNIDVLTGIYVSRGKPHYPVLYHWEEGFGFKRIFDWKDGDVIRCDAAGAGCLFVRRRVFEKIHDEFKEGAFSIYKDFSEDLSFFYRCMKLNIQVYFDTRLDISHLGLSHLSLKDRDFNLARNLEYIDTKGI